MLKTTKLGTGLLAAGAGTAVTTAGYAGRVPDTLTVLSGILAGACTALGATSLILGWAGRYDREAETEEV